MLFFCLSNTIGYAQASDFVTKWDLSKTGTAGNNSISFYTTNSAGSVAYTWQEISPGSSSGSGSFSSGTAAGRSITGLPANAIIELRMAATNLQTFSINNGTDKSRLIDVTQWGSTAWIGMENMFRGCNNINITSTDLPNLTQVTFMSHMFNGCTNLNGPTNIGSWNTANVTNMRTIFFNATAFNQNIGSWNTANVLSFQEVFYNAAAFNQNISSWNTAKATTMASMFRGATAFNQNISSWNTANVTTMIQMFYGATAFNQNISTWNTANVTNMTSMFNSSTAFNQNLGTWVLNSSVNLTNMLSGSGMNCDNYSHTLAGWALSTSATGRSLGATGLTYGTNVNSLRSLLTTPTGSGGKGWTISGDAVSSGTCGPSVFFSKSTGDLDDLATWGTNTNGSGTNPSNFTNANQLFSIRNRSTAGIAASWTVSGSNSMVIVGDASTAITVSTGTNTLSGNFKLTNNATLEIGSNSTGLNLICENGSTVNYNGSSAQTIAPGNYNNLSISGSNTKTLGSDIIIRGTLSLSNKLTLDAYSISLSGTVSGASSSNYVQTNSTGTLNKSVAASSTFIFPVGNSAYNPISITNNNSSADIFSLRVLDEVYYGGTTGNIVTEPRVKRTWIVGKSNTNTGSGVNFVFNWNNGEETGGITNHKLYQYDGSAWQKQSGTTTVSGRSLTYTSYNGTLAPFAVGDDGIPLPVSWFDMHCDGGMVQWSTASEKNSCLFLIERSINAETFETIGSLPAAGESPSIRNYSFQDPYPKPEASYYRVRMVDVAGKSTVSTVCGSSSQSRINLPAFIIYPNPTSGVLIIKSNESGTTFGYSLFTASGRLVLAGKSTGGVTHVQMEDFNDGVYHLNIAGSGNTTNHKIVLKH